MKKENITKQFEKQRIFQPDKVYRAMEKLKQIPYLKKIDLKDGEELRLNSAGIGIVLTAEYTGDEILGGETIKDYYEVTMPTPEIRETVKKIFEDLNEKTGLRFSAYDGDWNSNQCRAFLNFGDYERLDFILSGK